MLNRLVNGNKIHLLTGVCSATVIMAQDAVGAENTVELNVSGEGAYEDNRFLSQTNKQSVYTFRIAPVVNYIIEDENSQTIISANGSYLLSSDQAVQIDQFTYGGDISGNYQYERSSLSLAAGYSRQSIFDTEFLDSGQFLNSATRDRGFGNFQFVTQLNETWSLRLSDNFQVLDYSTQNLNNYWSNNVGVGLDVDINERTSLVQNFGYLRYEPSNALIMPLNSYSYLAGISYAYSENTDIIITGGATHTNDQFRWSAVLEVSHEQENNEFGFRAAREIEPSGLGGLRQSESVSLTATHNYSEGTNMGLNTSWRRSKNLNNLIQFTNEFIGLNPWISFEPIQNVGVRFSYQLRRQRIGLTNSWGVSNGFLISIQFKM